MADIKNKNELKRRTEMFLDEFSHEEYKANEEFCKETMRMMRGFIGRACHLLDSEKRISENLKHQLKAYKDLDITAEQVRELDRICTEKIQELTKYQKLEERLDNIFHGQLTLEKAVEEIELALVEPGSPHPVNAKILTYAESAEWENYLEMKENGKRIQLPCDVGDIIYRINVGAKNPVIEMRITNILISLAKGNRFRIGTKDAADGNEHYYDVSHMGKTLFLSKEEAEQVLKRLESET